MYFTVSACFHNYIQPHYLAGKPPSLNQSVCGSVCLLHVTMNANKKHAKTHARGVRRRTHTQNTFCAWVIFALERVRTQTFRSKTFRMYYNRSENGYTNIFIAKIVLIQLLIHPLPRSLIILMHDRKKI